MIIPFINFAGKAGETIAFYKTVFTIENKQVAFFRDMPAEMKPNFPAEYDNYVMHAELIINGTQVWVGDTTQGITPGDMVSLAIPLTTIEEARAAFNKLKVGGTVLMELEQTFYSPLIGTVQDRFGIIWHLICR